MPLEFDVGYRGTFGDSLPHKFSVASGGKQKIFTRGDRAQSEPFRLCEKEKLRMFLSDEVIDINIHHDHQLIATGILQSCARKTGVLVRTQRGKSTNGTE